MEGREGKREEGLLYGQGCRSVFLHATPFSCTSFPGGTAKPINSAETSDTPLAAQAETQRRVGATSTAAPATATSSVSTTTTITATTTRTTTTATITTTTTTTTTTDGGGDDDDGDDDKQQGVPTFWRPQVPTLTQSSLT